MSVAEKVTDRRKRNVGAVGWNKILTSNQATTSRKGTRPVSRSVKKESHEIPGPDEKPQKSGSFPLGLRKPVHWCAFMSALTGRLRCHTRLVQNFHHRRRLAGMVRVPTLITSAGIPGGAARNGPCGKAGKCIVPSFFESSSSSSGPRSRAVRRGGRGGDWPPEGSGFASCSSSFIRV